LKPFNFFLTFCFYSHMLKSNYSYTYHNALNEAHYASAGFWRRFSVQSILNLFFTLVNLKFRFENVFVYSIHNSSLFDDQSWHLFIDIRKSRHLINNFLNLLIAIFHSRHFFSLNLLLIIIFVIKKIFSIQICHFVNVCFLNRFELGRKLL